MSTLAIDQSATGSAVAPRSWVQSFRVRLIVSDTVVILAASASAYLVRFGGDLASVFGQTGPKYLALSAVVAIVWLTSLSIFRTRDAREFGTGSTEYVRIVNASLVAFGVLAMIFLIARADVARGFFILALPIGVVGLLLSRRLWRAWLAHRRRHDEFLGRALVVGEPSDTSYVIHQIDEDPNSAYRVVGTTIPVGHNKPEAVAARAKQLGADAVIVAGQPDGGGTFVRRLGWELEGSATELVLAAPLNDVAGPRIHLRPVDGLPLIVVALPQFEGRTHVLKRALDIVASAAALVVLSPLFVAIALAVRFSGPGPVVFRQQRVGRNEETFTMLKFRSMVSTAEDDLTSLLDDNDGAGPLFKMKNDPRVTRVGAFLRRYSLDELPQLWNVLRGDMSLVGPRPPLPREVADYENDTRRRLLIQPGITGLWQIGGRSDLSWEQSVRLDLYYVENWSPIGDLAIIWRTVMVLLKPSGAY